MADLSRRLHYAPENNGEGDFYFFLVLICLLHFVWVHIFLVHSLTVMVFCFRRCQISLDVHQMTSLSAASDKKSAG